MTRPPRAMPDDPADAAALVHALEVHQAELEQQNHELTAMIDELRRANAALAVAHDRYRALYDLAPAPLVTVDGAGLIVDLNAAAAALLGAAREHLVDHRLALFVAEAARPALAGHLRALFARGALRGVELAIVRDGEPPIDVLVDAVAVPGDGDRAPHAVLACVDVTAHHRALERQRLESLGVLAGGVAHDFNNLLTVILAGADHARRMIGPEAPAGAPLVEVVQAARQAGELAHQMLAYSGRAAAPARPIDLGALIRALEPLLHATAKVTPVVFGLPEKGPAIRGDETQVRQIVLNLVMNAAEAMHGRPGAITIEARVEDVAADAPVRRSLAGNLPAGRCAVLEVRDQGIGMDAATLARIFEPYYSTKSVGRGLGLATVQGIVRGHHGALLVESVPDVGTTFRVYLPVARAVSPRAAPPDERLSATGTVLLVDDDPMVLSSTARILEAMGLVVLTAGDGVKAIERFRADGGRIDLVLMDLTMPRLDGVAAATALRAQRADVPIVLTTGYGELPPEAGELFAGVLAKPYDVEGLSGLLKRLLRAAPPSR